MKLDNALRWFLVLGWLGTCSCGAVPPLGFTGDRVHWDIPLLAPLDGARLVVPVTIDGQGPYFFSLEPDRPISLIDRGVARALNLYTPPNHSWVDVRDRTDQFIRRRPYEVMDLRAGDLHVSDVRMYSVKAGTMWYGQMPLAGILGADLLTRTIVLDIDRDRGIVRLSLTGHQTHPPGVSPVTGRVHKMQGPLRKVVVPVTIAGARGQTDFELAVDLGAPQTAIFARHVPPQPTEIAVGDTRVSGIQITPFADRRVEPGDFGGVLGQDVLSQFRVVLDQDKRRLWLAKRATSVHALTADRLSRWGDSFARCQLVGCVAIVRDSAGLLVVQRDPNAPTQPFDVVVQPIDAAGHALPGLVRTRIDAPGPGAAGHRLGAPGRATGYRVVDASPFAAPVVNQITQRRGISQHNRLR